jgi:hypothetical protein
LLALLTQIDSGTRQGISGSMTTDRELSSAMAGLDPATHVLLGGQNVDARHKAGHDDR